ncbi:MAG: hypothetical protein ACRCZF_23400 [Gemmataceae bacterium]
MGCLLRVVIIGILIFLVYSYITNGFARIMHYFAWMHPDPSSV